MRTMHPLGTLNALNSGASSIGNCQLTCARKIKRFSGRKLNERKQLLKHNSKLLQEGLF